MRRVVLKAVLLAGGALFGSGTALAQADAQDIIVTARRVEERLQDVPISITVFNQDQLTDRNVTTASDLVLYTPSLGTNTQFGSSNPAFTLRGFVQEIGTQPTVGVYVADVVSPRGGSINLQSGDSPPTGTYFDLQNIQVLKGPQGTLFGRNTTGGAILVVPQRPTNRFEGYFEGSIGNYGMRRGQGVINIPVADWARFRFAIDRQERDGFIKNTGINRATGQRVGPPAFNDVDYVALRASLILELTPDIENYTVASYNHQFNTGDMMRIIACYNTATANPATSTPNGALACGQLARNAGNGFFTAQSSVDDQHNDVRVWQVTNNTAWSVSDNISLRNIISYGEYKQRYATGLFGQFWDANDANPALPVGTIVDFTGFHEVPGIPVSHQRTFSEEFRITGSMFGDRFDYQGGVYYEKSTPIGLPGLVSGNTLHCTSFAVPLCSNPLTRPGPGGITIGRGTLLYTDQANRFRNTGLYFQGTYKLTDELKLTGGIRYTWDKVSTYFAQRLRTFPVSIAPVAPNPGFSCLPNVGTLPTCSTFRKAKYDAPTWLVGLDYQINPNFLLYAKYSRGYRSGNLNGGLPDAISFVQPEKLDSYEAGIKSTLTGSIPATFNVSAFYNDFSNQILRQIFRITATGTLSPAAVNAGTSRIYGVEFEGSVNPFAGLSLRGSYAYLNSKITQITPTVVPANAGVTFLGGNLVGDEIVFTPNHKGNVTATYTLPLDESIGRVSFGTTYVYTGPQLTNASGMRNAAGKILPPSRVEGFSLVNLNASWDSILGKPVDLSFFMTNAFNKKYVTYGQALASSGFDAVFIGASRMYGFRLRFSFGQ